MGKNVNHYRDELDAIDRELLFASVNAVQDDVLRASTWLSGDKPAFEKDLDIIYGRIETLKKAKDEIKDERKSTATLDQVRFIMFCIGSALISLANCLSGGRRCPLDNHQTDLFLMVVGIFSTPLSRCR